MVIANVLIVLLAFPVDAASVPPLRLRADALIRTLAAGDLTLLAKSWSHQSISKKGDVVRLATLLRDRAEFDFVPGDVTEEPPHGAAQLQLIEKAPPHRVLERYTLHFDLEQDEWRIHDLIAAEGARANAVLSAKPDRRAQLLREMIPSVALARELLHRGTEDLDNGQADEALEAFTAASSVSERLNDAVLRAAAARGLGNVAYRRGDVTGAMKAYQSSLQIAEASGDPRAIAKTLQEIATANRVTGDYTSAEAHGARELALFRQAHDRVGEATALNLLANMRSLVGDYKGARAKFEQSIKIHEELNDPVGVSIVLNNLGIDARLQGSYGEALNNFRRALELSREANDPTGVAYALGNIGNVLNAEGNYLEALNAYQQANAENERLGNHEAVIAILLGIGELYGILGDNEQARRYLEQSYAMAKKFGFKESTAIAVHDLGEVASDRGELRHAITEYNRALKIDTELDNRSGMAIDLDDLGSVQARLGERAAAGNSFDKAVAIAQQLNDRETMSLILLNHAEMSREMKDNARALELAQQAVQVAQQVGLRDRLWQAELILARVYHSSGRLAEARQETERALAIVEELRRAIPGEELAADAFARMIEPYHEMISILVEQGDVAGAFEYAERAKARALLDLLHEGRRDLTAGMTEDEKARNSELLEKLTALNRDYRDKLGSAEANVAALAEASLKLRDARLQYDAFVDTVYAAHPQLRVERGEITPIRANQLDPLLRASGAAALLEYVVTEEKTYLFTICLSASGSAAIGVRTIAITSNNVEKDVERFRRLIANRQLTYSDVARGLYAQFVEPVHARIRNASAIGIVPDGALWELPFQALQDSNGTFLLEHHAVFYAPSLTVLHEMQSRVAARSHGARPARLLAFGNPILPTALASRVRSVYRGVSLGPLPETEKEVRRIAALYGPANSVIHVRKDAREEVVKTEAGAFDVLHFATHGILDDQNALYSRLLFSPSLTAGDDGMLEAREIMGLDLHADLAVLSACETARGRIGAGEGSIGMAWALFAAGCPTSVVSRWKVNSASTTDLMIAFHRNLRRGDSKAEALRLAALALRKQTAYRHPFYWAAFVIIGDGS